MTLTLTLTCKQPVVAVKVATQRLKPLRGGESRVATGKEAKLRGKCCAVNRPPLNEIANANRFIDFFHLERAAGRGGITQIENGLIVGERLLAAAIYGNYHEWTTNYHECYYLHNKCRRSASAFIVSLLVQR